MAERQQDLDKNPEVEKKVTLVNSPDISGELALRVLIETLDGGNIIHIPALGLVITPGSDLKEVADLTADELERNPHIR